MELICNIEVYYKMLIVVAIVFVCQSSAVYLSSAHVITIVSKSDCHVIHIATEICLL